MNELNEKLHPRKLDFQNDADDKLTHTTETLTLTLTTSTTKP